MNEVLKTIKARRSTRSYGQEQVSAAELQEVLEAGCCAPYAGKPSHLTVVQDAALIGKINDAAKQAALHMGMPHLEQLGGDPDFIGTYGAPTVIFASDEEDSVAPDSNCAVAAQNMLIAAESLGLGACWVFFPLFFLFGEQADEIRQDLRLPTGHKPCACIALGYKGPGAEASDREFGDITFIP